MKQTAVEWLVDKVFCKHTCKWKDVIEQAKAMEKEQIVDAYKYGNQSDVYFKPEQYYQQTYGGNNHIADTNKMVCLHSYSRSMNQPYPRKCTKCGEVE